LIKIITLLNHYNKRKLSNYNYKKTGNNNTYTLSKKNQQITKWNQTKKNSITTISRKTALLINL